MSYKIIYTDTNHDFKLYLNDSELAKVNFEDCSIMKKNSVCLTQIQARPGYGKKMLCTAARKFKEIGHSIDTNVILVPITYDSNRISQKDLIDWYRKRSFKFSKKNTKEMHSTIRKILKTC